MGVSPGGQEPPPSPPPKFSFSGYSNNDGLSSSSDMDESDELDSIDLPPIADGKLGDDASTSLQINCNELMVTGGTKVFLM